MFKYIQKEAKNYYFENDGNLYDYGYNMGTTYEDFQNGKFILMTNEQIAFHEQYPDATVEQVINLEVPQAKLRTLEEAKRDMLRNIDYYDRSTNVNGFTINGSITAWFTPTERSNYKQSVEAAKLMGIDTLTFYVGDNMLTVSTAKAELMLAAIQLYADQCYIITKQHKLAVNELETVEEVDSYNYRSGYPEKLNFDLFA